MKRRKGIKVEEIITERIVNSLKTGIIPWRRPWWTHGAPRSIVSGKEYRGINVFLLSMAGFSDPRFLTYKQAQAKGGNVKKGERGFPVVFYKIIESKTEVDKKGNPKKFPMLRYYTVFNVSQIEGIDFPPLPALKKSEISPIEACERVVNEMPNAPEIDWNSNQASYSAAKDKVSMPPREQFEKAEEVYSTLFHELVHSTGHKSRLARGLEQNGLGSGSYAREELIAEMGAAFLCGHCQIETQTLDNSAAYIATWLKRLKDDPRLVISAGSKAQAAADYILNEKAEEEDESDLNNVKVEDTSETEKVAAS